jgi:hypothetical protein
MGPVPNGGGLSRTVTLLGGGESHRVRSKQSPIQGCRRWPGELPSEERHHGGLLPPAIFGWEVALLFTTPLFSPLSRTLCPSIRSQFHFESASLF